MATLLALTVVVLRSVEGFTVTLTMVSVLCMNGPPLNESVSLRSYLSRPVATDLCYVNDIMSKFRES